MFYLDKAEPDEDPEVTRAKYFIRDEFLVNRFGKKFFKKKYVFVYFLASQYGYR